MKENKTYEEALQRLEELLSLIESDQVKVAELSKLLKEAEGLTEWCESQLRNVRNAIQSSEQNE